VQLRWWLRWARGTLTPEQEQEFENGLKAWIALGGVGARTRRGCGALTVVDSEASRWLPSQSNLESWFRSLIPQTTVNSKPAWTVLKGAHIAVGKSANAMDAWRELSRFWARFRKGQWSDYQHLLQQRKQDRIVLAKPFLGLPIIYQNLRLEPADSGRMASPVILKPLALANGQYVVPLVAVLNAPAPDKIRIYEIHPCYNTRPPLSIYLQPPNSTQEPLLHQLRVNSVLEAVIAAAKQLLPAGSFTFTL